ncbi:MAG: ADP-ribosylglycohydrolase family protein [Chloroflexi bacterium]|nr:ADP-ribosylglycohydrolase family protein [Chloroflexota bacterium]
MKLWDYPDPVENWDLTINRYATQKVEFGAQGVPEKVAEIEALLRQKIAELDALPNDPELEKSEPNDLEAIRSLRPSGARRMLTSLPEDFRDRLEGAWLARCAGCTLGSIVEGWKVDRMERWAAYIGDPFPLVDYWSQAEQPQEPRLLVSQRHDYTPSKMDGVPSDDDLNYTMLGLLILEEYGPDFTVEDVGAAWVKYLPVAFTAEGVALENLRNNVPAMQAGALNNPCQNYIGADIRSDPWGYAAPGWPEKAAELAWRDAMISHRRNGVYSAMYWSAVIAAAFAVDDPMDALRIGLEEIPTNCIAAREIRWALDMAPSVTGYKDAAALCEERYPGLWKSHSIQNNAMTVWGLAVGGDDYTKMIGETVAMGQDNDCTAATAGSVFGAVYGRSAIPEHWTKNFNNTMHSYLIGKRTFAIDDTINRFAAQAERVLAGD